MKVFVVYGKDRERITVDIGLHQTVRDLREIVRDKFRIGPDEGPAGSEEHEKLILTLTYSGADLNPKWFLADVGLQSGVTLRAVLRDEVKTSLFIHVVFTGETKEIQQKLSFHETTVAEVRGMASVLSGLPVGCFRLVSPRDVEMYDIHVIDVYGINMGDTLKLEIWDGWSDFLKAAFDGQTTQVMAALSPDEVTAHYQSKVALYVAAHCGHVDLAVTVIKESGIRADEPVGYHPTRQWCKSAIAHVDSLKTPIHESAQAGRLGVLRSLVYLDIGNVLARDGKGLTPLNLALRAKQKACASFLLAKQWSKVPYAKKNSLPLSIFVKMRNWCERSREKTFVIYGQWKSSLKRKFIQEGLVGYGVQLDGFSKSAMNSLPADEEKLKQLRKKSVRPANGEDINSTPETYFKLIAQSRSTGLPKMTKILMNIAQSDNDNDDGKESNASDNEDVFESPGKGKHAGKAELMKKLPPIKRGGLLSNGVEKVLPRELSKISEVGASKESDEDPPNEADRRGKKRTKASVGGAIGDVEKSTRVRMSHGGTGTDVSSSTNSLYRRPLMYSSSEGDIMSSTMEEFHRRHGMTSREYANKCLSVAGQFKDKTWMSQVHQALIISRRGVKKTFSGIPHLFASVDSAQSQSEVFS